jgi:hypothetical protein
MNKGFVAIGSRAVAGSDLKVRQSWYREGSKVRLLRDSPRMFLALLRVRSATARCGPWLEGPAGSARMP